eukprot:gi/632974407/ref/XP_007903661.1/ PREDICTED: ankyrin repeat and EF-hand domain-containing protein 1 isoform X2 [Callorhinchus milii]
MSIIAEGRLQTLQVYKLLQCVRQRDKGEVEKLIRLGLPYLINVSEPTDGECALHLAATANDVEMCRFLLSLDAHPDVVDKEGRTAAMKAGELGHNATVQVLADANTDMTIVDVEGRGILYYCICPTTRHLRCVEMALAHGADVNNCANDGKPVFLLACEQAAACTEMCLQILEHGADPNSKIESTGHTVLIEAAREGAMEVVHAILEKGCDVNAMNNKRCNAGHFAAQGGFFQVLRDLIAYDCDVNVINMDGNTALHLAAMGGFVDCVRFLTQRGCNPKIKNLALQTPRTAAKANGQKLVMKELRKAERIFNKYSKPGARNPNEPWAVKLYDWSLAHEQTLRNAFATVDRGDDTVTKEDFDAVLQERSAPLEPEQILTLTRMHDKAREGVININEFFRGEKYLQKAYLISSYEPKKKKKKKGRRRGKKGKLNIPIPICIVPPNMLRRRADGGPPEFMIEDAQNFTDPKRFDRDHPPEHPLQDDSAWYLDKPDPIFININYATKSEDVESLTKAFFDGVPIDVHDKYYKTPLMTACADGNLKVAKYLLEMGAHVNVHDNLLWTALHHACHGGQLDIVELLLRYGAQVDAVSIYGATPLMRAIESCRLEIVSCLLEYGADVELLNKKGQNALDIAYAYSDIRVVDLIRMKMESIQVPKVKEKVKVKGKGASGPPSKTVGKETLFKPPSPVKMPRARHKTEEPKDSIVHKSTLLSSGLPRKIDITFTPRNVWGKLPTTEDLIQKRVEKREAFGYEVDFSDYLKPFRKNILKKIEQGSK